MKSKFNPLLVVLIFITGGATAQKTEPMDWQRTKIPVSKFTA